MGWEPCLRQLNWPLTDWLPKAAFKEVVLRMKKVVFPLCDGVVNLTRLSFEFNSQMSLNISFALAVCSVTFLAL